MFGHHILQYLLGMMGPPPGSKRPVDIRGPMVPGPPVGPGSAAAAAAAAAAASKNASSKKKRRLADKILPQKVCLKCYMHYFITFLN